MIASGTLKTVPSMSTVRQLNGVDRRWFHRMATDGRRSLPQQHVRPEVPTLRPSPQRLYAAAKNVTLGSVLNTPLLADEVMN